MRWLWISLVEGGLANLVLASWVGHDLHSLPHHHGSLNGLLGYNVVRHCFTFACA